jgi:hypothetical protein
MIFYFKLTCMKAVLFAAPASIFRGEVKPQVIQAVLIARLGWLSRYIVWVWPARSDSGFRFPSEAEIFSSAWRSYRVPPSL